MASTWIRPYSFAGCERWMLGASNRLSWLVMRVDFTVRLSQFANVALTVSTRSILLVKINELLAEREGFEHLTGF